MIALFRLGAALLLGAVLAACSKPPPPRPAVDPQSTKDLAAYNELVQMKSYAIAVTMGREILRKYPGTPAAAEVQRTLAGIEAQATAGAAEKRLAALWIYQAGPQPSGQQSAASIYSSQPSTEADRVRLILRRHSEWGESAYIFAGGQGFKCGAQCTVGMRFDDGAVERWPAHSPETGEPAIFIDRDRDFVARMSQAQKLAVEAELVGKGPLTMVFEVGGYDAARFVPLPPKP